MNFYRNGNYTVWIMSDGTKVRQTEEDDFKPSFAENVDVKITSRCRVGCEFCYESCTKDGEHGDLFKYPFIESLHPYTEMALNGNDLDHPDLERFLLHLKEKKVFANMTVHQFQFIKNYNKLKEWTNKKLIYGLGISYHHYDNDFINRVKEFPNSVLHVINGIISKEDIDNLRNKDLKILILGYKVLGRGIQYRTDNLMTTTEKRLYLYDNIQDIIKDFKVVSFDNLALKQLDAKRLMTEEQWNEFYMGDDGDFTFYIDMVEGLFAQNSLSQERFEIGNLTIDQMFDFIRLKKQIDRNDEKKD